MIFQMLEIFITILLSLRTLEIGSNLKSVLEKVTINIAFLYLAIMLSLCFPDAPLGVDKETIDLTSCAVNTISVLKPR